MASAIRATASSSSKLASLRATSRAGAGDRFTPSEYHRHSAPPSSGSLKQSQAIARAPSRTSRRAVDAGLDRTLAATSS